MFEKKFDYDIGLSFAGEDRKYVMEVAGFLTQLNVSVFYDEYEEAILWGKDLYQHLQDVYRTKCKYTIIFISESYAKKLWTKHELKSAQSRAFEENHEYMLPVRFDDTEIPGILPTMGYIDLRDKTPYRLTSLILQKLSLAYNADDYRKTPYYITFDTEEDFDTWHNEVNRLKGYPRYGRNAKTGKVAYESQGTLRYAEPIKHRLDSDKRVACIIKEEMLPPEMIDKQAEKKYKFVKRTPKDIEEIGFRHPLEDLEPVFPGLPFLMRKKDNNNK